jgi:hypothetical protein
VTRNIRVGLSYRGYDYWLVVLIIALFVTVKTAHYPYKHTSDAWEHTAALKELATHLTSPKNPNILSDTPTPRYSPYLFGLAVVKKMTGLSVFSVMRLAAIMNLFLLTLGIYIFTKEYFRDGRQPLYTLVVMFFFWGVGYFWSGAYHLSILPHVLPYPSMFTFALSLISLYFVLRAFRTGKWYYYLYPVILGFVVLLSHPLTGAFLFLSSFLLVVFDNDGDLKHKLIMLASMAAIVPLSFLWPYYPIHKLFIGSVSSYEGYVDRSHFYSVKYIMSSLGPGLLGLLFVYYYFMQGKFRFVTFGFGAFFLVYFMSIFLPIPLGWRFIFFFLFFLHLATSRKLRELDMFSLSTFRQALRCSDDISLFKALLGVVIVFSVVANIIIAGPTTTLSRGAPKGAPLTERYDFLHEMVGQYDVVMADDWTSWVIPSFSGKVVAFLRSNPLLRDNEQRRLDHRVFFAPETTSESRRNLIKKYDVSYILLNLQFDGRELIPRIDELGDKIYEKDQLILYKTTTGSQSGQ